MPPNRPYQFGIRNSEFGFPDHPPPRLLVQASRVGGTACGGGAWHPDPPRVGVPGILTGSATKEVRLVVGSASLQSGRHDRHPRGRVR
jgi:hypothetical protein